MRPLSWGGGAKTEKIRLIDCSRRDAIIVNVFVFFYAKFSLDRFDFSSDFYALDFLRFAWSKILSQSQFQAAELNWRQFNTKSQMKTGVIFHFKS